MSQSQLRKAGSSQPRSQQQQTKPNSKGQTQPQSKQSDEEREAERQRETSKAAQQSLKAQKQAKELLSAAAAAGDPDERQKLLNEALNKEVEAERFGKTARYLQTGAFQGLCAGAGMGGGIGISLGAITGTLVGGLTSPITGGLGAGIGLGVGALHGPWFKVGDMMGKGIRKITGDIPGWKATDEQKSALGKMVNGVQEQDRPSEEDLTQMTQDGAKVAVGKGYIGQRPEDEQQESVLQSAKGSEQKSKATAQESESRQPSKSQVPGELAGEAVTPIPDSRSKSSGVAKSKPRKLNATASGTSSRQGLRSGSKDHATGTKRTASAEAQPSSVNGEHQARRAPRKLEVRSDQA